MCVYIYTFQILSPYRLSQNIEESSPHDTVDLCWLPILNVAVCIRYSQIPNLSTPPFSLLLILGLFAKSVGLFLFCK